MTRGVDVHHKNRDGHTALFTACVEGHHEYLPILLDAGLNVEELTASGQSMLHGAAIGGSVRCAVAPTLMALKTPQYVPTPDPRDPDTNCLDSSRRRP